MRHRAGFNHLGIKSAHRKSLLANMSCSLITHKRIYTTIAKAKALKTYVEPLITRSKKDTTHDRRIVYGYLNDKEAVSELFRTVAPKIAGRQGGYTRILKTGFRAGDSADMCFIELVDFNENMLKEAKEVKSAVKKTRRGGGKSKKETASESITPAVKPAGDEKTFLATTGDKSSNDTNRPPEKPGE